MPDSRLDPDNRSPRESGEDSEDESEILEESPCGRWLKRREEVDQRDVPGIDCAHLAMDTEEGVEVVWNEVLFSERKSFRQQEEKIRAVFENLTLLAHPNIVNFHRYWTDTHNERPRVIFITEYMSSGSLKQFLKRTKRNVKRLPLPAWKRWCTQILSALSYLHSCSPPIIHGNLSCDTIFIQHNGLVKIGSVAPDSINDHVKTCRERIKNIHFVAPELGDPTQAMDVFAFGMCALEMAALEIQGNNGGDTTNAASTTTATTTTTTATTTCGTASNSPGSTMATDPAIVADENIRRTIDTLEDPLQRDFIAKCLASDPNARPAARELLFHPLLFEVHSLKLLAAHVLVNTACSSESITDDVVQRLYGPDTVMAEIHSKGGIHAEWRISDVPIAEKLEKFVEDVRYGIYPLTAFISRTPPPQRGRAISPEAADSVKSVTPEPLDMEMRKVVNMMCNVKPKEDGCDLWMTLLLRMDDKMNRQLTCQISSEDTAIMLSQELVHLGFIHETDRDKVTSLIEDALRSCGRSNAISQTITEESNENTTIVPTSTSQTAVHSAS